MLVTLKEPTDLQTQEQRVRREPNALQRDRYRAVLPATQNRQGEEIARQIGRSPRFVDEWVGRCSRPR